jgi:hypothetical protein
MGATIWVGGHLLLLTGYLRRALRERSPEPIIEFERLFIRVGLPSFLATVATGVLMGLIRHHPSLWLDLDSATGRLGVKVLLVASMIPIMVYAERRLLPSLRHRPERVPLFAALATVATAISIALVIVGWMIRFGI